MFKKSLYYFLAVLGVVLSIGMLKMSGFLHAKPESIITTAAISHGGRVAIKQDAGFVLEDIGTTFTAYASSKDPEVKILVGPVFGEHTLQKMCQDFSFLVEGDIVDNVDPSKVSFFQSPYPGCALQIDERRTAAILQHTQPFTELTGKPVKYVAIVTDTVHIDQMLKSVSFSIDGRDLYLSLLQIGQLGSPFTKKLDWKALERNGLKQIGDTKDLNLALHVANEVYIPKLYALDSHSLLQFKDVHLVTTTQEKIVDEKVQKWTDAPSALKQRVWDYTEKFHGHVYNNKISYLYVPATEAFPDAVFERTVREGRQALKDAKIQEACGLIVDLRFNTGGDMHSMLLTLGGVLSPGKLFGYSPTENGVFLSEDGNALGNAYYTKKYKGEEQSIKRDLPVAILTNFMTASAGEVTALSLKENIKQARLFGEATAGALSANEGVPLWEDGSVFLLMTTRVYSPSGQLVPLNLEVDEKTEDNLEDIFDDEKDPTIKAARAWLESVSHCKP